MPVKPESANRVPCRQAMLWFVLANAMLLPLIFGRALWGDALLAPLDILPVMFSKYEHVDPHHAAIPANHFIIDGIVYDLPVQKTIYEAYRRGEMPWWDPYSLGGRPLLADAHINGTDFFRVFLYRLLPFELAFNWTRIAHFFFSGCAALLLLWYLRFPLSTCVPLALAYEFAGAFAMFFCHPWIQASFLYYPVVWLLWDSASERRLGWREALAGLLCAGIFYSGNLQSHTYLPLFALAFSLGYGGRSLMRWKRALGIVITSGAIGGCLAAPVLLNQCELYAAGLRLTSPAAGAVEWKSLLSGIFSLSAIYPWMFGTFRTLDLGKWVGESGLGFSVYLGSVAFCLAVAGLFVRANPEQTSAQRMAAWLCALYFGLILSTPFKAFLYTRSSGLALLGLMVLAAIAVEWLRAARPGMVLRRAGITLIAFTVGLVVVIHAGAFIFYPRYVENVRDFVGSRTEPVAALRELREFQIRNWPREVTFQNPETILAAGGLICLALILLRPAWRRHHSAWLALLLLNAAPLLLFAHRFIPRHPVELWHRLEAGGPEQQRVKSALAPEQRLLEVAPGVHVQLFPNELQHLHGIRTVHGYAAIRPRGAAMLSAEELSRRRSQIADWSYVNSAAAPDGGQLTRDRSAGLARFHWRNDAVQSFNVRTENLNRMRVTFSPGPGGELVWTDSPFPGWHAIVDGRAVSIAFLEPCFSLIQIPAGARELVLYYRPSFLRTGMVLAVLGLAGVGFCMMKGRRRQQRHVGPPP